MKEILIEIPVRCVSCGYPEQYGAKVIAEIRCKSDEEVVRKIWKCPICNCTKTIEVVLEKYVEKKPSRFMIQSPGKREEELSPGMVSKMKD